MDENKVLCKIEWTVKDVITSFENTYKRKPTEFELEECIDNISWKLVEETGISNGWVIIDTGVAEAVQK